MPSRDLYKKLLQPNTNGSAHKMEAWDITEETWYDDPASTVGYLYDWDHDDNKTILDGIPTNGKIPLELKFIVSSSQTFDKDQVTYHIQMRPHQECNVDYYDKVFANRYNAKFPVGLYIDLPDAKGTYNRWLVVGEADGNDPFFPTYEVLRCNYVVQCIVDRVKYNFPAVLRSQNS